MISYKSLNAKNQLFWHITANSKVQSIKSIGINQNKGQEGLGVYCIKANDYDALDSVLELKSQENIGNLVVVEFIYSGMYKYVTPENRIYQNEGWAVIPNKITVKNIIRISDINSI